MVVIRLARVGRHKYPQYRIVAADKRRAATSKFLAILGTYNPHTKVVTINKEEIDKYLKNGAQPSDRVLRLLISQKIEVPTWAKTHDRNKAPKNKEEGENTKKPTKPANTDKTAKSDEPSTAEDLEQKSKDQKEDLGTAKEQADQQKQAETTEKVAKAVEESVKKETTDQK